MGLVLSLTRARLSGRGSAAALIATAVGGCILVLGSLQGVGAVTADQATRRALADLPVAERVIRITLSSEDAAGADAADALARTALDGVQSITDPLISMTMYRPPRAAIRVLAIDGAATGATLVDGRFPTPCPPLGVCEVLRIGSGTLLNGTGEIGTSAEIGARAFTIVGTAEPGSSLPLDLSGTPGLILLADGVTTLRADATLADVPRSSYWLAPLDPSRTHSWMLDDLSRRVDVIRRDLPGAGRTFKIDAPEQAFARVAARADIAVGRLVFLSSLVIGVLLAFAVFAAAAQRPDVAQEYRRLRANGAGRAELAAFIGLEAGIPSILGSAVGLIAVVASVALIAAAQAEPPLDIIRLVLRDPVALSLIVSITALSATAVAIGIHPASGRFLQPRLVGTATIPVVVVLIWDRVSRGSIDATNLASEATSPGTVLLPGLLGLAVILGSLIALPPVLRRLARLASRSPLPLRLATLSIARDPLRPAATLTLLAFSLGCAVLGVTYAATLTRGAADEAAFVTGLDIRVLTYSPSGRFADIALPRMIGGDLGADVEVQPIVRIDGSTATGRPFKLTGLDPAVISEFRRWREDLASASPATIGQAIALPGPWVLPGHPLPAGIRDASVEVDYTGDPVALTAILEREDGTYRYVDLGDLATGHQVRSKALFTSDQLGQIGPAEPAGWQLVGVLVGNGGPSGANGADPGGRQQGDLQILGIPEVVDPSVVTHVDVSGLKTRQMIRAAVRTDDLVIPALVSPDLAADVGSNGELGVTLVSGLRLRLRPTATASRFPTVVEQGAGIIVVDRGPLQLAMTARDPGTGTPNQVLLATPNDARTASTVGRLSADPYPSLVIQSRPAIEAAKAQDPFAIGIVWALAVGALAGLILSVAGVLLGVSAELRDQRGELRELEELGVRPANLRMLVVLKASILALAGITCGAALGIGLGWLAAVTIAVSAEAGPSVIPLALVTPWSLILPICAGLLLVVAVGAAVLARRRLQPDILAGQRR